MLSPPGAAYTSDWSPAVSPEIFRLETELLRQRENTIEMEDYSNVRAADGGAKSGKMRPEADQKAETP